MTFVESASSLLLAVRLALILVGLTVGLYLGHHSVVALPTRESCTKSTQPAGHPREVDESGDQRHPLWSRRSTLPSPPGGEREWLRDKAEDEAEDEAQEFRDRAYYHGSALTWKEAEEQGYPSSEAASAIGARWAGDTDARLQIDCSEPPCIVLLSPSDPTMSWEAFERSLFAAVLATGPQCASGPVGFTQQAAVVLVPGLCQSDTSAQLLERVMARAASLSADTENRRQ